MTKDQETALCLAIGILRKQDFPHMASDLFELRRVLLATHAPSTPAPVPSPHTGVIVKSLLDEAFRILRPDSPDDCPEEPHMRVSLGKQYWAILGGKSECEWPQCECALFLDCAAPTDAVLQARNVAWQPIKTAPKDGKRVLVYEPGNRGGVHAAHFLRYSGKHDQWVNPGAHKLNPTHWMPLPASPPKDPT